MVTRSADVDPTTQELLRLRAELAALTPLVEDMDRLQRENEALREQLEGARRRIDELAYQRDRNRYQLLKTRNRRLWRALTAFRDALRQPRMLLRLPLVLFRILAGRPAALPPEPQPPDVAAEATGGMVTRAPTDGRTVAQLREHFIAPPPAATTRDLRIAAILDDFSASCFEPEARVDTDFRPDNWRETLERDRPHLLLVESAWKGNGGSWQYQVGTYSYAESVGLPHLSALVAWCREHDIPTVFWNKEDPVHFDRFKEATTRFDVVLTTDADRVGAYRGLPGLRAHTVGALPFAAQPRLHNPLGTPERREPIPVFAGTYYRNRHPERREQLEVLLDVARPFGLTIFDRTAGQTSDSTGFPERFAPHIKGGLPYDEMVKAYRQYRVFLNTNSVTASPTMFSRRVFELLACGTPVVSTPSVGMEAMLGSVVRTVHTAEDARTAIEELLTDDDAWLATSRAGIDLVLSEHTYTHRLGVIARAAGLPVRNADDEPVTVLVLDDGQLVLGQLGALLHAELPGATALVGSTTRDTGSATHAAVRVLRQEDIVDPSDRLRELAGHAESFWVVVVDGSAQQLRAAGHLLAARRYAAAEVFGVTDDTRDRYAPAVAGTPVVLARDLIAEHGWDPMRGPEAQSDWLRDHGARAFTAATDPLGQA